jgi:chemotaxis protein methyltransferase CheR
VLIYFDKALQAKVHGLFYDSLAMFGILCLGSKESMRFSPQEEKYEQLNGPEKIFRKSR